MAYSEYLAERVEKVLKDKGVKFEEKKMMGGLCFMVDDKMCIGITNDDLMARLDPEIYEEVLKREGARPMDFTGRPMKGFVFVSMEVLEDEKELDYWIDLCLEFNPKAKSSKKKKT